jgi:hypothetical protein
MKLSELRFNLLVGKFLRMNAQQIEAVVEQLRGHRDRLREVLAIVGSQNPLSREAKERAQSLMKLAKEALRADHMRMSTVSGQNALNPTEDAFLRPAVHEVFSHLQVKSNSYPSTAWSSDIYEAIADLEFYLHQLESPQTSEG